ncbi:Molybdenum cofactor synthesis protein cinnamon [Grifola frondosa]|uniref:molybdopterin adenylyltransferase n=1 Tax=Grifola frondosa TaxID=5627 RepID=A0A1C7M5A8_GRIFR|nr:Molybdenum cofactor synthesis protein cinnamon [Grifola frondosa]
MSAPRVAVLTVSDTASADASADRSGPIIRDILSERGYECKYHLIVPDDEAAIRHTVQTWCDQDDVDWVITTGGTGFGVRDRTPEAIRPLIERDASGLVHLLLAASLQYTPLAALSRPVAGTAKNTLIITLPGSVKAVKENLAALLNGGVVDHALDLIRGGTGKQPRTTLSHDPSLPASARHRESPYPLVSVKEALDRISAEIEPPVISEELVTSHLRGYVLAEDVYASQNVPSSYTTNVDGYALRHTDPPGVYKVVTSQTHSLADTLPADTIYRINTGGPLPAGADAVIMVEDTRLHSTIKSPQGEDLEENEVETLVSVPKGDNVRNPGSDVQKGDLVLEKGHIINSAGGEIGTLAFVGRTKVKPSAPGDGWGGIWDTNRPSLQAVLEGMGYKVVDLGIVPDDLDAHVSALKIGLECADMILTTGAPRWAQATSSSPVKPGKPTTFATIPTPGRASERVPIFALPGNPASALVTFHIFVVPALRRLGGWPSERCNLPSIRVQLQDPMRLDPRPEYHRAIIKASPVGFKAYSTGGQRSSRVASLNGANGLVALPARGENGPSQWVVGDLVETVIIGEIQVE